MRTIDKILQIAQEQGVTQADLARAAMVPPSRVTEWKKEDGKISLEQALRIAKLLNVELGYLADESAESPPPIETITIDERLILKIVRAGELNIDEVIRSLLGIGKPGSRKRTVKNRMQEFVENYHKDVLVLNFCLEHMSYDPDIFGSMDAFQEFQNSRQKWTEFFASQFQGFVRRFFLADMIPAASQDIRENINVYINMMRQLVALMADYRFSGTPFLEVAFQIETSFHFFKQGNSL